MKSTIDMARKAGWPDSLVAPVIMAKLTEFAALVRADEAAKYTWNVHSCGPTCTKAACVAMRKAVEAEREACAKVCDDMAKTYEERAAQPEKYRDINPDVARIAVMTCGFVEVAIRARGQRSDEASIRGNT
jgi:hypothetical protein